MAMALIEINIGDKQTTDLLKNKLDSIMATLQEISDKADQLQAALDEEQEQIASAISALQATVSDLTTQLTDGGTAEQRQAVLDKLNATITDLQATIPG